LKLCETVILAVSFFYVKENVIGVCETANSVAAGLHETICTLYGGQS
jgi:hypothetical protein